MSKIDSINSNTATCESSPQIANKGFSKNKQKENLEIACVNQRFKALAVNNFISEILQDIIDENSKRKSFVIKNSFYMKNPPNMSFLNFSKRINKYLKPEVSTLIISLMYIDSLLKSHMDNLLFLTENNVYKIYLTSVVLAIKYNEDYFDDNDFFGKVGGISTEEMNTLERDFLILMDYKMYIPEDLFRIYEENFEEEN